MSESMYGQKFNEAMELGATEDFAHTMAMSAVLNASPEVARECAKLVGQYSTGEIDRNLLAVRRMQLILSVEG